MLHGRSYNSHGKIVPKRSIYGMKYDRQSISLVYGLPHTNRTNWPIVIVWRQITPKGRCWNPALFFRESDRVDPPSRIYRSLSQPLCVDKAFGEDTASWVSVSMNNYLEKFYLSVFQNTECTRRVAWLILWQITCDILQNIRCLNVEMFSWE